MGKTSSGKDLFQAACVRCTEVSVHYSRRCFGQSSLRALHKTKCLLLTAFFFSQKWLSQGSEILYWLLIQKIIRIPPPTNLWGPTLPPHYAIFDRTKGWIFKSCPLFTASEGLGKIFKGNFADMSAANFRWSLASLESPEMVRKFIR